VGGDATEQLGRNPLAEKYSICSEGAHSSEISTSPPIGAMLALSFGNTPLTPSLNWKLSRISACAGAANEIAARATAAAKPVFIIASSPPSIRMNQS
jgi:hypothetical protein